MLRLVKPESMEVRKRVNQKIAKNKKSCTSYSTKSSLRFLKPLGMMSPRLSVRKQPLELSIGYLNQVVPLQKKPIKLMHNRVDSRELGQKINQIVVQSSEPEIMFKQISQAWGEAFAVDYCLIITVEEDGQLNQNGYWCSKELLPLTTPSQFQLFDLISLLPKQADLLAINDLKTLEIKKLSQEQDLSLSVRAILSIPTYFQGKQNGLITLGRLHPYQWHDYEQQSAQVAAESVAIALTQVTQLRAA